MSMRDVTINAEQFHTDVVKCLTELVHCSSLVYVPDYHVVNPMHEIASIVGDMVSLSGGTLPEPRKLPEHLARYICWLRDQAREGRKDGFVPEDANHGTDVWAVREFARMFGDCIVRFGDELGGALISLPDCLLPDSAVPWEMLDAETQRRAEELWRQPAE